MNSNDDGCNEVPGTFSCAQRNWNTHTGQDVRCNGNGQCVSSKKDSSPARLDTADAFRHDPATALRHMGYQQNEARKRAAMAVSTIKEPSATPPFVPSHA